MTVHMARLFLEPPKGDVETAVDNWVANHNEWTADPDEHSLTETNAGQDGTGSAYVRADYRFVQEETPTQLLDDLTSRLDSIQDGLWYRIGYHICDHDGEPDPDLGPGCATDGWGEKAENGTIPSDIPTFN